MEIRGFFRRVIFAGWLCIVRVSVSIEMKLAIH